MPSSTTPSDQAPPSDQPQPSPVVVLSVEEPAEPQASSSQHPLITALGNVAPAALDTPHAEEGALAAFPDQLSADTQVPLEPPPGPYEEGLGEFARQQAWIILMATLSREQRILVQEYIDASKAIWKQLAENPGALPSDMLPQIERFARNVPHYRRLMERLPQETVDKLDAFLGPMVTDMETKIEKRTRRNQ
ncbi:hypothetical protein PGTUg99_017213 [Puccinia graminis f. sp. tritici]|uniref:Uncharacterized protein n=1 Tax=Puccinia graminis f. sp. tritici TaxID=56615 RepID=A0A5B0RR88_PUCGR|nr:hypothetical protein PGTUg99_017213 [Puccinia graminis f. sp. tritici]